MAGKVWFITGTSKGLGRAWAEAALARGDQVAATARDLSTLCGLVHEYGAQVAPIRLDVTDRDAVFAAVATAQERFGRLDVVVNNAGYGLLGAVEEVSEAQARAQIETNLFGALWVTQAALPILRAQGAQGSGHIIQVSSIGGVNAFPMLGLYHASKWALEGMSQALQGELAGTGVKVTLVEPGGYATEWKGSSMEQAEPNPAYDEIRAGRLLRWRDAEFADPGASGPAILRIVDAAEPPLRVFFGPHGLEMLRAEYERRLAGWEQWQDVASLAVGR
ncbi:SDR family oxidoreductase [Inquilinus sp.]|uniref:SDR family oxidoreductase n=1 Tax=Inquilinus sp. TaxID=1932117 RepID=UPI0037837E5E